MALAPKSTLSGFEQLAKGIPEAEWMQIPELIGYVEDFFETRYCPEWMIAELELRFSDPELNTDFVKPTTLAPALIGFADMTPREINEAKYDPFQTQ